MRPTVHDIAREAKVSLATVDRVLNKRPGVRAATVARVEAAIARIGYVRDIAAANLARQQVYRLAFLIPDGPGAFMRGLEQTLEAMKPQLALERTRIDTVIVPAFDAPALAAALNGLDRAGLSGVALVATGSDEVRAALARLAGDGVPVVTLVSDMPDAPRDHYVGIDNVAAGRSAASLLGRFVGPRAGKIVLVAGSLLVRDHVERREGFEAVMRESFPQLEILPALEGHDDMEITRRVVAERLSREDDLAGLYNIGAGNRGVIAALRDTGKAKAMPVVAHELSDHTRAALCDGTFDAIINQDAGQELRSAIALLRARIDGRAVEPEKIRIEIYIRDNLP